jgi:hypothetical protein
MRSKPMIPLWTSINKSPLGPSMDGHFQRFSGKDPQGTSRLPRGSQKEAKAPQGVSNSTKSSTEEKQMESHGVQRRPMAPQRFSKKSLHAQKIPIKHVIQYQAPWSAVPRINKLSPRGDPWHLKVTSKEAFVLFVVWSTTTAVAVSSNRKHHGHEKNFDPSPIARSNTTPLPTRSRCEFSQRKPATWTWYRNTPMPTKSFTHSVIPHMGPGPRPHGAELPTGPCKS